MFGVSNYRSLMQTEHGEQNIYLTISYGAFLFVNHQFSVSVCAHVCLTLEGNL